MRDDDRWDDGRQRFDGLLAVLVDVDDEVGRRELANAVDIDVLRATDLGDAPHDLPRVNAEAGSPDEL